eukprot:7344655-Pyramimonas_sp.AAC.1
MTVVRPCGRIALVGLAEPPTKATRLSRILIVARTLDATMKILRFGSHGDGTTKMMTDVGDDDVMADGGPSSAF